MRRSAEEKADSGGYTVVGSTLILHGAEPRMLEMALQEGALHLNKRPFRRKSR